MAVHIIALDIGGYLKREVSAQPAGGLDSNFREVSGPRTLAALPTAEEFLSGLRHDTGGGRGIRTALQGLFSRIMAAPTSVGTPQAAQDFAEIFERFSAAFEGATRRANRNDQYKGSAHQNIAKRMAKKMRTLAPILENLQIARDSGAAGEVALCKSKISLLRTEAARAGVTFNPDEQEQFAGMLAEANRNEFPKNLEIVRTASAKGDLAACQSAILLARANAREGGFEISREQEILFKAWIQMASENRQSPIAIPIGSSETARNLATALNLDDPNSWERFRRSISAQLLGNQSI